MRKSSRRPLRIFASDFLENRCLLSATYYVDANAPGTAPDGYSWDTAYTDLQYVLQNKAASGDTIKVADGTYKPTPTTDRTISFNLVNGVGIFGGYAGFGASDPDARDVSLYPTILSGDIGTVGNNWDNTYHVVIAISVNSSTVLDGITVTQGYSGLFQSYQNNGGGMINISSSPTLTRCTFTGNMAYANGGGMYNDNSSPTLTNCTFTNNSIASYGNGGGIYNFNNSSPTLANCTFNNNTAAYDGGGMCNVGSSPMLSNCAFNANTAVSGGGIFNDSSSPIMTDCSITRNSANYPGGGMYNIFSSPILTNCTFMESVRGGMYNSFSSSPILNNCSFIRCSGVGMLNSSSSPTLTNCLFLGNSTSDRGGGMYNEASTPILINCIFSGNTATSSDSLGGGMYNNSSSPGLINCTFSGNSALLYGGAIYNNSSSSPKLTNCILCSNGYSAIYNNSSTSIITYSDIEGGYTGTGNINTNPGFVSSPRSGLDFVWGTSDDDYGDLRLRSTSPCLDAGLNSANSITTDLDGNPRIQNSTVDMGAYEGGVPVVSKTLYVDCNATGSNDGSSWANAFTTLQPAIAADSDGDTIKVADGTYKPTTTTNRSASILLQNNVSIIGGYAGVGAANPDARDLTVYPTVLSGDISSASSNTDNSFHIMTIENLVGTVVLEGLTFAAGYANGSGTNQKNGGAILILSAETVSIKSCIFLSNYSSSYGGAIYNSASTVQMTNCGFIANSSGNGGVIYNSSATGVLANCTLVQNSATSGSISYGVSSSLTVVNSISMSNGTGPFYNGRSSTTTVAYSDIQGSYTGTGNINADPLFVRAPGAGSDGKWGTADDEYGDLKLQSTSPCINAGLNSANTTSTDLAGNPRIQDGVIDMGAYEGSFPADQKTFYVDKSAKGNNSGSSWANAFVSLQTALTYAVEGDVIKIADGIYKPTSTTDRSISFNLVNGVAIYGGYVGLGAANPDARDITLYPTIFSGDIGTVGTKTDNSYHVVAATGVNSSTVLDGVTITLGYGTGSGTIQDSGGGMFNLSSASPTLTNCTFSGNYAYNGGGMYNSSLCSPILNGCSFTENTAANAGGGIYNYYSSLALTNCAFTRNSASDAGGGIYDYCTSPSVINCVFFGNTASNLGGGICNYCSSPTLINTAFSVNTTSYHGGGIHNDASSPTLINCTFTRNTASSGGGLYNSSYSSYSYPKLTNCILWNNGTSIYNDTLSITTVTYSDIQDGYTGTGNIKSDPLFVRAPSSGTDGKWGTADDVYGDLHLQASSPAIDSGNNSAVPSGIIADLAGNSRFIDIPTKPDTGVGTFPIVDMGAYETTLPTAGIVIDLLDLCDSGISSADNITSFNNASSDKALQFNISGVAAGMMLNLYDNGIYAASVAATGTSAIINLDGVTKLADGSHVFTIRQGLSGGVLPDSPSLTVVIDSTIPFAPVLCASSDTGISNSDGVTFFNGSADLPLNFTVPGTIAGATVCIYANGMLIASAISEGGDWVVKTDGSNPLANGTYKITARQQAPGKALSSDSLGFNLTVDATAPAAVMPDLQASSDSGVSDADNITSDNTPTLDVAAAYYTLYCNGVLVAGPYASGAYTSPALSDGTWAFTAVAMDAAGNMSPLSSRLSVTIDTRAPAAPTAFKLDASSDTGASNSDSITNDNTPTFDLAGSSAYFRIYRDGSLVSGMYEGATCTLAAQPDGDWTYNLYAVDAAGNPSAGFISTTIKIDTAAPTSQVASLPLASSTDDFSVNWSGDDNAGGSGVSSYDIYVSDDGAAPVLWLNQTTALSGVCTGQFGHVYSFFSVAYDIAGNVEPPPSSPDAQTTVLSTWAGTCGDDEFALRLDASGSNVEFYARELATDAVPLFSIPLSIMQPFTIAGKGGNDRLTIDFTNGNPIPAGGIALVGSFALNIIGSAGADVVSLDNAQLSFNAAALSLANVQSVSINTGAGDDMINLYGDFALPYGLKFGAGAKTLNLIGGARTFLADLGDGADVALNLSSKAKAIFGATQHLRSLNIGENAVAKFTPGLAGKLFADGLTIGGAGLTLGKLDLADCDMVLSYRGVSPYASMRPWFLSGIVAGRGVFSSTGSACDPAILGMADNAMIHMMTLEGVAISDGSDFRQLVVHRTRMGDVNLDGMVDKEDELTIMSNMGRDGATYFEGDINYGGAVTLDDLAIVQANLGAGMADSLKLSGGAPVKQTPQSVSKTMSVPTIKAKTHKIISRKTKTVRKSR